MAATVPTLQHVLAALAGVPWSFVMALGSLLIIYLIFRRRSDVFRRLAFGQREVAVLCLGSIAGWAINVPVVPLGGSYLALNVGGALVPAILVGLWYRAGRLHVVRSVIGVLGVAAIAWTITSFDPSTGIVATYPWFFLPSVAALGYALVVTHRDPVTSIPVAYTAGSLGALLGADLVRLPQVIAIFSAPSQAWTLVSIGGAGVFDMVFLAGAVAMAGDLAIVSLATGPPPLPLVRYPAKPMIFRSDAAVRRSYEALGDPNASERAYGALAASNLALASRDHGASVRASFQAVDAVLRAGEPPILERLVRGDALAGPDEALATGEARAPRNEVLVGDLRALAATYRRSRDLPVDRLEAGHANEAARSLVKALVPILAEPMRLEGT